LPRVSIPAIWAVQVWLSLVAFVFALQHPAHSADERQLESRYLTGKLLVARPEMPDPRFHDTVIFIAKHDENGAFGLIVNRPLGLIDYATIIENLGVDAADLDGEATVYYGGPVDPKRGFILHSNDYPHPPLIPVNDLYSVTMGPSILLALANGFGPKHSILAIGYTGWGKGQLERELKRKDWVVAPSEDNVLFDKKFDNKWKRAFDSRYIDI
jgi:putative transcriptional regulator